MIQYMLFRRIAQGTALLLLTTGVQAQQRFILEGKLHADSNGVVQLTYYNGKAEVMDSATIAGGRFTLTGTIDAPRKVRLVRNPLSGRISYEQYINLDAQEFYLVPGNNVIAGKTGVKKAVVSNEGAQHDYEALVQLDARYDVALDALRQEGQKMFTAKNDTALQRIKSSMARLEEDKTLAENEFIDAHPNSYVAFDILETRLGMRAADAEKDGPVFAHFSRSIQQTARGKSIQARIEKDRLLGPGHTAPDFTLLDTTAQPVTLSSLRGKYVLLGFWNIQNTSTRSYVQAVKQLQQHYTNGRLVILSVGFVNSWESWINLLHMQAIPGLHLADINGVGSKGAVSEVAKAYGLTLGSFPRCYLLDKEGRILLKQLAFDASFAENIQKMIP